MNLCEYEKCDKVAVGAYSDQASEGVFLCREHSGKLLDDLQTDEGPLRWRYSPAFGYHIPEFLF